MSKPIPGPNGREKIICQYCGTLFSALRLNPTYDNHRNISHGLGQFCSKLCHQSEKKRNKYEILVSCGKHQFIATDSGIKQLK